MTPIWLDCDTGHDDAFAILLAAHHPNAQLLGISTFYGNAPCPHTTVNTLAILQAIGKDVPVYMGASAPYCRPVAFAPEIHGETGLDGTTCLPQPIAGARTDKTAIAAMHDALIATEPGTAWLVATGALTNVALLFSVYPQLASHIAGLSIMGGAIGGLTDAPMGTVAGHGTRIGNWTPWAEFNIYIDDHSAKAVFDNKVLNTKTILAPLDLTHQFLATEEVQQMVLASPNTTPVRQLFFEILTFFAKTYADVFGIASPPLHDPLAVAALLAPQHFVGMQDNYSIDVVIDGAHGSTLDIRNSDSQCGRTIATKLSSPGVKIPRSLDKPAVWKMLNDCLTAAELSTSAR